MVHVTTAAGDRLTLRLDPATGLPSAISSLRDHVMLGDCVLETRFSGYEHLQPQGVRLPKRLLSTFDRFPDYDIGIMSNRLDVDTAGLVAPASARNAAPPAQNDTLTVEQLAPGVWHLTGGYRLSSVVVEFADHLAIVEVPNNEQRAQALFAQARALRPGKPLTTAVFTHFHFDHAGGLRAAVAEGLTIHAHRGNEAFFREVAVRKKTLNPDALTRRPRPLKLVAVDDTLKLRDSAQELQLLHARGSPHADTMLMAYLPGPRILVQGDLWTPGSRITPHAVAFAEDIDRRGLQVSTHVAIDSGQVKPDSEFRSYVARLRSGAVT